MANYLYNGVELPALPDWDKATYPYAYVGGTRTLPISSGIRYTLYLTEKPLIFSLGVLSNSDMYYTTYHCYEADIDSGVWTLSGENTHGSITANTSPAVWSNYDIYEEDSTTDIYLAASDPIPVNPAPTLDPTALLMGWQVGNRIRQRGGA